MYILLQFFLNFVILQLNSKTFVSNKRLGFAVFRKEKQDN